MDNARIIRIIGHFRRMKSDIFRLPLPRTRYIPGPSDRTVFQFEKIYREGHKVGSVIVIAETDDPTLSDCK